MLSPRQAKIHHLVRPVLKDSRTKRRLVHVRANMIPPARGELVKLVMRGRCVAIGIALEIGEADMHDDVNALELGQAFEQVEREGREVVRIEKCKVQAVFVQTSYDFWHRRACRTRDSVNRRIKGRQTLFCKLGDAKN